MQREIYYGNLKECIYAGYVGNFFGAEHYQVIEEGVYFVKLKEHEYMTLDEILSNKKKKTIIKDFATQKGEIFAGDLICVNDLVDSKKNIKK